MRVLLLGATGNVGSRLLPALIQRGHVVTAMVRDPSRLPTGVQRNKFHVERGDASKATAIKTVAMEHECDAIVNAAGAAAVTQWGKSDLQTIVDAVIRAALEIGQERGEPLRLWVFAGIGILDVSPKYMLVDYFPIAVEHRQTLAKIQDLPRESVLWSILCPSKMMPLAEPVYPVVKTASVDNLLISAGAPPQWSDKYLTVPIIGGFLNVFSQAAGYLSKLEDNADFIASDLLLGADSPWIHQRVGTREKPRKARAKAVTSDVINSNTPVETNSSNLP